jgi:hypothetical protein
MGLALRVLLVDRSDRVHRFGIAKFDEMRRNPARHRYPQFAGQRVRTVEAVVQLVDRKPTRVVRMTFDIFTFDRAGCFDSETFERQQFSRFLEEEQQRRQAVIEGLRGEIEKGRRSGKPKPASEVLDRLERKYTKMANDRRK